MKKRTVVLLCTCVALFILGLAAAELLRYYKVTTVYVEGNVHYNNEEIMDMVMTGKLGDNSLYLALKYKNKGVDDIPFIQTMDVDILSPDTIRITVYEKALAGYIQYLDKYMYFDKDGIIVEASDKKTAGIPQVTGLTFGYVVMHEKLPVDNPDIFADILDITQLLNKYGIQADKIQFSKSMHKTLYFGEARVSLGSNENIGEKIMKLQAILPELTGKKGLLRMDNYSEEMRNITFEIDTP